MKLFMQLPSEVSPPEGVIIDHLSYKGFLNDSRNIFDLLKHGYSSSSLYSRLCNPSYIQKLYHERDPGYFAFLNAFFERFRDFDVIVMNPGVDLVHPEFLVKKFPNTLKCMHCIDDPHLTYSYCLPYVWAFDCATYISPGYSDEFTMEGILTRAGFKHIKWVPHCVTNIKQPKYTADELQQQLSKRNNRVIYVGNYYTSKTKRLIQIKKELGDSLDIYGRYPFGGFSYTMLSTFSGSPTLYRVKTLTELERERCYDKYGIGLNMHLSNPSRETGNARVYELAYRGVAQVVDSSVHSLINNIFVPEKEILTYGNIKECVDQIKRLQHDKYLRISLAQSAYNRAVAEYQYKDVLSATCKWFTGLLREGK
jgi:hypothetical protein